MNKVIWVAVRQYKGEWIAALSKLELEMQLDKLFPETEKSKDVIYVTFE